VDKSVGKPDLSTYFLEKDDDLDFSDGDSGKSLASLKHKAAGDKLTDLSAGRALRRTAIIVVLWINSYGCRHPSLDTGHNMLCSNVLC
jgi:hypothetical protein